MRSIPLSMYLIHKPACMKAQAIKEHLLAEDVHFFNSDEQRNCTGSNNRADDQREGYVELHVKLQN